MLVLEAQNRSGGRTWTEPLPPLVTSGGGIEGRASRAGGADGGANATGISCEDMGGMNIGGGGGSGVGAIKHGDGQGREAAVVDLGGMVVTGTLGNPLVSIARSYGVTLRALGDTCNLYGANGSRIDTQFDVAAEVCIIGMCGGAA